MKKMVNVSIPSSSSGCDGNISSFSQGS